MKTQHIISTFLVVLLIISGCREITVTTKVNNDGSFTRTIKVTGDSSSVYTHDLPYPVNDTWIKKLVKDTTSKDDYILTYTKTFKGSSLLNDNLKNDTSWRRQLNRRIDIDKRYGFFYSYLTFNETYPAVKPFERLNYPNQLTTEDMQYLSGSKLQITAQDSAKYEQVSDKFEDLLIDAIANEIIIILQNGIKKLNDPDLNPDDVENYRDSIEQSLNTHYDNMDIYIDLYRDWTGNKSADRLKTLDPPIFDKFNRKVTFLLNALFMDSYMQEVEMPGLITETSSISVTGNKVNWKVDGDKFIFQDYDMKVESRVVNRWPSIISGIFLFLVIIFMLIKVRK